MLYLAEVHRERPLLTVLDFNKSGLVTEYVCLHLHDRSCCLVTHSYVPVDALAQKWQRMGVDPPQNQSMEEALLEVRQAATLNAV